MINCGINKVWLLVIFLFIGPYIWLLGQIINRTGQVDLAAIGLLTFIFTIPIYTLLFQVKTIRVRDNILTIFYPFRLWTRNYNLKDLEKWNYRKTTKAIRFQLYLKSRYVTLKFRDNFGWTILFSLGLTNFDDLLKYLNEGHKELRTNKKFV